MQSAEGDRRFQLTQALVASGEGDREAFRTVYRLTSAKLFGICLRICCEREAAEDVLHEVYLTVWRRAGAFDPGRASPITWLATIARNKAIDWRRAHSAGQVTAVETLPEVPDNAPIASEQIEAAGELNRLHRCLAALEPRQQAAIRTAFFEGITYAELAERQAVPLGTLKSWVRRGLMTLKLCLDA